RGRFLPIRRRHRSFQLGHRRREGKLRGEVVGDLDGDLEDIAKRDRALGVVRVHDRLGSGLGRPARVDRRGARAAEEWLVLAHLHEGRLVVQGGDLGLRFDADGALLGQRAYRPLPPASPYRAGEGAWTERDRPDLRERSGRGRGAGYAYRRIGDAP